MRQTLRPEKIERVVVRGANWVGDAVMTVAALRELRRVLPRAHITLATRAWAVGVFEGADFLDELMVVGETRGLRAVLREAREWRARRFDLGLLFPNAFAPALTAFLARVPSRVGYAAQHRGALLTHPLAVPGWRGRRHEVFYYLNIVAELERMLRGSTTIETNEATVETNEATVGTDAAIVETSAPSFEKDTSSFASVASQTTNGPQVALSVGERRRLDARALLSAEGFRSERALVALCPGSTNSRAKRWPVERFAALADMLIEEAGAQVALIGASEETEVSEEVARRMRARPIFLTGKTDLSMTAAVLSAADLLVTNDTGPAHVAAAVGCPVVVVFGPTNPVTTRPFSALATVVRRPPECAPCMLRDCPIDHRCMTAISADEVFAHARRALEARRGLEVAR